MRVYIIREKFFSSILPLDLEVEEIKTAEGEIDQSLLLSFTFYHDQYKSYPPSTKFCKLFIRKLITIIESCGEEVNEDLYNVYLNFLSTAEVQSRYSYKSYSIKNHRGCEDWLVLKESSNIISDGTTGLSAWQAAYFMSEWIMCNNELFKNKSVIELGSGTGILGLVISKICRVKDFLFTDHHGEVLKVLEGNISINGWTKIGDDDESCPDNDLLTSSFHLLDSDGCLSYCKVGSLDWELASDDQLELISNCVDDIVASDVVFDTRIIPSLVRVIKKLLQSSSSPSFSSCNKTAYICGAIRNQNTWDCFIETCGRNEISVEAIAFSPPSEQQRIFKFVNHSLEFQIVKLTSDSLSANKFLC